MSEHHMHVLAFVGLAGAGVSSVIEYLTGKGYPKVSSHEIASQIEHLEQAGQHVVVTEELTDREVFKTLQHEFHGELTLVAVTTNVRTRHARLERDDREPNNYQATNDDWRDAPQVATLIALADYSLSNDDSKAALFEQVDKLLEELKLAF